MFSSVVKKTAALVMVSLIIGFTIIALLGIWEIIDLQHVIGKTFQSLLVVFVASAVILFIFTYLIKDGDKSNGGVFK